MTPDNDPYMVYRAWPEETVREALVEFNTQMHDDAGIEELRAGLHCFDFLCRRSDLDDTLLTRIDAAITEARMRIALLSEADAEHMSQQQWLMEVQKSVQGLQSQVNAIRNRFLPSRRSSFTLGDEYDDLHEAVFNRVKARLTSV